MRAIEVSVKLPDPATIETGLGMICGTEDTGAVSARAAMAVASCAMTESGRLTARQAAQASAVRRERRRPRTLPAHLVDLIAFISPTSRADQEAAENVAGRFGKDDATGRHRRRRVPAEDRSQRQGKETDKQARDNTEPAGPFTVPGPPHEDPPRHVAPAA